MKKPYVVLIPFFTLTLTSCNVSYESFKNKAEEICNKEHSFTKGAAIVKGNYEDGDTKIKIDEDFALSYSDSTKQWSIAETSLNDFTSEALVAGLLVTKLVNLKAIDYAKENEEGIKYYSTFGLLKIVDERDETYSTYTFTRYGLIKKVKTKSGEDKDVKLDATLDFSYHK